MNITTGQILPRNTIICTGIGCDRPVEAFLSICKFCGTDVLGIRESDE